MVTVIKDLLIQSCLEMVAYPFSLVPTHRLIGPISRAFDRLLMLTTLCSNEGGVREVRLFTNSWKTICCCCFHFGSEATKFQQAIESSSYSLRLVLPRSCSSCTKVPFIHLLLASKTRGAHIYCYPRQIQLKGKLYLN